jgi:hypothetical protein
MTGDSVKGEDLIACGCLIISFLSSFNSLCFRFLALFNLLIDNDPSLSTEIDILNFSTLFEVLFSSFCISLPLTEVNDGTYLGLRFLLVCECFIYFFMNFLCFLQ